MVHHGKYYSVYMTYPEKWNIFSENWVDPVWGCLITKDSVFYMIESLILLLLLSHSS